MTPQMLTLVGMVVAATASTLIPHPPNFSPAAAIALFAGAHFATRRAAFAVPLIALLLRDVFVGLHVLMPFVYGCYALNVCLGFWVKRQRSVRNIALASLAGSCVFFLITNFGVWLLLGTYPPDAAGLIACYVGGLSHFANSLLGDLLYAGILFGAYALAQRHLAQVRVHA